MLVQIGTSVELHDSALMIPKRVAKPHLSLLVFKKLHSIGKDRKESDRFQIFILDRHDEQIVRAIENG